MFYFYVRTQFVTISRSTSASCEWRTSRAPCGRWTRSSSTGGGRREAAAQGKAETGRLSWWWLSWSDHRVHKDIVHISSQLIFPASCHFDTCCPVSVPFTKRMPGCDPWSDMFRAFFVCCEHSPHGLLSALLSFLITNLFLRFWYCITPFNIGLGLPELHHKCTYY